MRGQNRSGCPRSDFLKGGTLVSPPFRARVSSQQSAVLQCHVQIFARSKTAWTLSSLWTHKTRPQVTLKTAQTAVFNSVHTDHVFLGKKRRRTKSEQHNRQKTLTISTPESVLTMGSTSETRMWSKWSIAARLCSGLRRRSSVTTSSQPPRLSCRSRTTRLLRRRSEPEACSPLGCWRVRPP